MNESFRAHCIFLHSYAASRSVGKIKRLHAHTITAGLFGLLSRNGCDQLSDCFASAYALCGCLRYARNLFDKLSHPSLFLYNAMVRTYSQKQSSHEVLKVFGDMVSSGRLHANNFTYPFVIKACGDMRLLKDGAVIHGRAMRFWFGWDCFVQNALLAMYMNCGEVETARRVFYSMRTKTVVSWNTMISGCFRNGCADEAVLVFHQMLNMDVEIDSATVVSVLPACGLVKDLALGERVHQLVEEKGLLKTVSVWNSLIDMYAKCGRMNAAQEIFDQMGERDVITWTTMITGHIWNDDSRGALAICWPMQVEAVKPNSVTIASLLSACADSYTVKQGRSLHGWAIRQMLDSDTIVRTALIDMYAKCNQIGHSLCVLTSVSEKRTAPWNAVLSGYINNDLPREAMEHFILMLAEGINPDVATIKSLLPAYANLADLQQAHNVHGYLIRSGFIYVSEILTALVDIYSKCGHLDSAYKAFDEIPWKHKDIISWSALISGYGMHGHGKDAVSLFKEMVQSGVKPNEITFTSALHACSHAGLVNDALDLFKTMCQDHPTIPYNDHYTCMVDLLGRFGRLDEAYDLIKTMPFHPNHAVWGALLGACVIHENVDLGEIAARQLFEMEPENSGNYVLMGNIYAATGRWEDAENMRSRVNDVGLRKAPAQSLVEVRYT